jgi:hypothetical protein
MLNAERQMQTHFCVLIVHGECPLHAVRETANGKRQTANGKRQTANGKRQTGASDFLPSKVVNRHLEFLNSKFPITNSIGNRESVIDNRETANRKTIVGFLPILNS